MTDKTETEVGSGTITSIEPGELALLVKPNDILEGLKKFSVINVDTRESDMNTARLIAEIKAMPVTNETEFKALDTKRGELRKHIAHVKKVVLGPLIDAFNKAHKDSTTLRNEKTEAADAAYKDSQVRLKAYTAEENRKREEEARRIAEIQRKEQEAERARLQKIADEAAAAEREVKRKEAEALRLKEAEEAEAAGDAKKVTELLDTPLEVEEVQAEVIPEAAPMPAYVAPAAPKMKGATDVWDFRVIDKEKVPHNFLVIDEVKVRAHVKTHKHDSIPGQSMDIPGIEPFIR